MGSREDARRLVNEIVAAYNAHDTDGLAALYHDDITYWTGAPSTGCRKALQRSERTSITSTRRYPTKPCRPRP